MAVTHSFETAPVDAFMRNEVSMNNAVYAVILSGQTSSEKLSRLY
jgi:hypothetical protein